MCLILNLQRFQASSLVLLISSLRFKHRDSKSSLLQRLQQMTLQLLRVVYSYTAELMKPSIVSLSLSAHLYNVARLMSLAHRAPYYITLRSPPRLIWDFAFNLLLRSDS